MSRDFFIAATRLRFRAAEAVLYALLLISTLRSPHRVVWRSHRTLSGMIAKCKMEVTARRVRAELINPFAYNEYK